MKTYNLWARVGMDIKVNEEQIEGFLNNPEQFIIEGLKNGNVYIQGDSYLPEGVDDNDSLVNEGVKKGLLDDHGEIGWDYFNRV